MVEVEVTRIVADDSRDLELLDGRIKSEIWVVPTILELSDGCTVQHYHKVHGNELEARRWHATLPRVPLFRTTATFDEKDDLVKVTHKMAHRVAP